MGRRNTCVARVNQNSTDGTANLNVRVVRLTRASPPSEEGFFTMTLLVERSDARAWTEEQMEVLFAGGFPTFITADLAVKEYIGRVREYFPHLDVMLVDVGDTPVATGWGVPTSWWGDVADLPCSFADVLRRALEVHDAGVEANTFVICGAVVDPGRKGTGTATELIRALSSLGEAQGMTRVLAPLRPTRKHLYPLFSIEDYIPWVRDDGLPFDPWLRLHVRKVPESLPSLVRRRR